MTSAVAMPESNISPIVNPCVYRTRVRREKLKFDLREFMKLAGVLSLTQLAGLVPIPAALNGQ